MKTILRKHYTAQLKNDAPLELTTELAAIQQLIAAGSIETIALFQDKTELFLYLELPLSQDQAAVDPQLLPTQLFSRSQTELKEDWQPMTLAFVTANPVNTEEWRRKTAPHQRCGRIAHLRPEKTANYLDYHLQMIEEGALYGNKYQSIALWENTLFFYNELPKDQDIVNIQRTQGATSTVMPQWLAEEPETHFVQIENSDDPFYEIREVFSGGNWHGGSDLA